MAMGDATDADALAQPAPERRMLRITAQIALDERELSWTFVRSSGPGGQNVNSVSTAAELRLDVAGSPSIPGAVKHRLRGLAGRRLTSEGILVIQARRFRTQERNRHDARERLVALLREAATPRQYRVPTRPTRASGEARLCGKKKRADTKRLRRRPGAE